MERGDEPGLPGQREAGVGEDRAEDLHVGEVERGIPEVGDVGLLGGARRGGRADGLDLGKRVRVRSRAEARRWARVELVVALQQERVSRPSPARSARTAAASLAPAVIPRCLDRPSGTAESKAARLASSRACWLGTWAASVSCSAWASAATA